MNSNKDVPKSHLPQWVQITGAAFGAITLMFIGILILLSTGGYVIPVSSRYLLSSFLALGTALSTGFLGADAAAKGSIPLMFAERHAIEFGAGGGVAVFVIIFLLVSWVSQASPQPIMQNIQRIAFSDWQERSCEWELVSPTNLISVGPKGRSPDQWWLNEPDRRVDCEIVYLPALDPPTRISVDILILSGEGKGGLIFNDDGSSYSYVEARAQKDGKGDVKVWRNRPFAATDTVEQSVHFDEWISLTVEVLRGQIQYYFNNQLILTQRVSSGNKLRVGLRSAFSSVQFKFFTVERMI